MDRAVLRGCLFCKQTKTDNTMNLKQIISDRRKETLKDKFRVKQYSEAWAVVRIAVLISSFLIQLATAACAVVLPAFAFYVLFGHWVAGFAVGVVALGLFELVKRGMVNNAVLAYFRKGTLSATGVIGVVLILSLSVLSSYFGTPILVNEFAPMPKAVDVSKIEGYYMEQEGIQKQYWVNVKSEATSKAKEIHSQNNWRGTTTREAAKNVLSLEAQAKAAQDSLNTVVAALAASKSAEIQQAKEKYLQDVKSFEARKSNVGFYLAFVTLFLELVFVCCIAWLNFYDFSQAVELGVYSSGTNESAKPTFKSSESSGKSTDKIEYSEPKQRTAPTNTTIGYHNEGKVMTVDGTLKVLCRKADGSLKWYSKSNLSTLINSSTSLDRKKHFIEMKEKLVSEQYKTLS